MLKKVSKFFQKDGEFQTRIKKRHKTFWSQSNAELIRNIKTSRNDSIDIWEREDYWQRKLSNKYNSREFAIKHGCKVADLYWKGADLESLDFSILPGNYVIRPTIGHSSNLVFLMHNDINLFDNKTYTSAEIKNILKKAIIENPKVEFLFEEFIQEKEGEHKILNDYKFFCFNGEIACCHVIDRSSPKTGEGNFYDEHWNKMPVLHTAYPLKDGQKVPDCYQEMVEQVKRLSKLYKIFVRIDFYASIKGAIFGEFTPTPGMGRGYTNNGEKLLVQYWDQHCKGLI